jgi:AraC-like DNA-binding protein/ligand-binding sensor protein
MIAISESSHSVARTTRGDQSSPFISRPGIGTGRFAPVAVSGNLSEPRAGALAADSEEESSPHELVAAIGRTLVFQEYAQAFAETFGLPLAFRSVDSWQLPHHRQKNENPFCAALAQKSRTCSGCLQAQQQLSDAVPNGPAAVVCRAGLTEVAAPVLADGKLVGLLQTGQFFTEKTGDFRAVQAWAAEAGVPAGPELRDSYSHTRVLTTSQRDALIGMLSIFAEHLGLLARQLVVRRANAEPPVITRAKQYIRDHQTEELSLERVSHAVHVSSFYFCKLFRKATGLHFTDYVNRVRIDRAKNLLLNPNLQVSEIAFEIGFQSLTHFNRVFKKTVGQPPLKYRAKASRA